MTPDLTIVPAGFTPVFFLTAGIMAISGLGAMCIVRGCLAWCGDPLTRGILWIANLFIVALCVGWIDSLYHQTVVIHPPQAAYYKHHK